MKIELLKTFLEVSRTLHFRLASEALFITQSAVSARIKLLEDDLGVTLFDRSQKHLSLTAEGHRLIKHANELIFMWEKTKQDVGIAQTNLQQLAIGSTMSIWDVILQQWLQEIDSQMPDLSLLANTHSQIDLRRSVLNGVIDVAFLFEPPFVDGLITEKVATVPLRLVSTTPNTCLEKGDFERYILVDYGESVNALRLREFKNIAPAKHAMTQPRIALNFILDNGGSAYLPEQLVKEHIDAELFYVDEAPIYEREIFAVYLSQNPKLDILKQSIQLFSSH